MKKIKKMAAGGTTVDCKKNPDEPKCKQTYGKRGLSSGAKKGIGAAVAGVAALVANKKYGLVDKAKQALGMKKGGTVKRTAKKK